MAVKRVSLVGSHARRDGWMELTPLRGPEIVRILKAGINPQLSRSISGGAAKRQHVGPPLSLANFTSPFSTTQLLPNSQQSCIFFVSTHGATLMKTRIQKWGNSLALRIPKSFAVQTGLDQDVLVDVTLVDGKLIVSPVSAPSLTLEQLLAGVTDANWHTEYDTGEAIGNEGW
jgi:antitoxin MazE